MKPLIIVGVIAVVVWILYVSGTLSCQDGPGSSIEIMGKKVCRGSCLFIGRSVSFFGKEFCAF